ncbi:PKD domain-containing protein [Pedobacter nototheniae]|uniref:PKD domain-containing protein n=1 Tax=Pedobacter nototheniae TaxID=2488994 RepID=UPI0010405785|nr:PKD domain-containing protein [Pedobacter nototheniae]
MGLKNINIPIETFNQIERGGVARTVSASLTRFAIFSPGSEQPAKTLIFRNATGITDFQPSFIQSGNLVNDVRYYSTGNFTDYNIHGQLLSGNNAKGQIKSALYDDYSRLPLASINNARQDEILYSNFEQGNLAGLWFEANGQSSTIANSGKLSVITNPSAVLYRSLKKKVGSTTYILSTWINSTVSNTLNVSVINTANQIVSNAVNIIASSGNWKYYQVKIPVASMSQTFTIKLWASSELLIDDVIFRPEEADVQIGNYDIITENKLFTAAANGMASRYDYDAVNRIKHVYDQDKNIVQKMGYVLGTNQDQFAPSFTMADNQLVNTQINFSINSYPVFTGDGLTYTWNFGDGSPAVVTTTPDGVLHTYTQVGNYTASITKSSPYYGSVTVSKNLTVSLPAVGATKLYSNSGDMMLTFYQNGQIVRQFSQSEFNSGTSTIDPGAYTIRVGVSSTAFSSSNPNGYKSIQFSARGPNNTNVVSSCLSSQPGVSIYEFYMDLTGKESLTLYTDPQTCVPSSVD